MLGAGCRVLNQLNQGSAKLGAEAGVKTRSWELKLGAGQQSKLGAEAEEVRSKRCEADMRTRQSQGKKTIPRQSLGAGCWVLNPLKQET